MTFANNRHVCALGSSFASGPGIQPLEDERAGRSTRNYAHLLAGRLGAELTDLSVAGATLENVLDKKQDTFPPQLDSLPADADVVTITGGGNDMDYIGAMMRDSGLALGYKEIDFPAVDAETVGPDVIVARFIAIIDRIRQKAPRATVYLVEYINVLGDVTKTGQGTPLSAERIAYHRGRARVLAQTFRDAAQARPGTVLVPISEKSEGHEIGSVQPWVWGFDDAFMYHPNAYGHQAVADELSRIMS